MSATMTTSKRSLRPRLWGLAFSLLLIPAIAMQFTAEMNWGPEDFIAGAVLIGLAGLGIELALRLFRSPRARLVGMAGVLFLFVLVWAELAVGIFT